MSRKVKGLRKLGNTWYVDISHPSLTKRLRFTTRTGDLALAQQIRDKAYRDVLENSISGYRVKNITVKEFEKEFIDYSKINHSAKTTEIYELAFKKLPPDFMLRDIKPFHIENIKRIIPNKTTFNIYYNHLHAAFNYAISWEYIKSNPLGSVKKLRINEKTRRDIHADEFKKLIDNCLKDHNQPFADFLKFMLNTGCRRSELINLEWDSIHYDLQYFELKNTKGRVDALIAINDKLIDILKKRSSDVKPFNYLQNFATKKFKYYIRYDKKHPLPDDLTLHSIRHATTTILFKLHEHPLVVQNLLRHKDLKTTIHYNHTSPDYLKSAINKMTDAIDEMLDGIY